MSQLAKTIIFGFIVLVISSDAQVSTQLSFVCNMGQVTDQYLKPRTDIKYYSTAGNLDCYFRDSGVSYYFKKIKANGIHDNVKNNRRFDKSESEHAEIESFRLDIEWINSKLNTRIDADNFTSDYSNFYNDNFPQGLLNVRGCEKITYKELYNGINLCYYFKDGRLKYDYIVKPTFDWRQIKFKISGADRIFVNQSNELVIVTPFGEIIEDAPDVRQGSKKLNAKWVVNNNTVSFHISGVDPKKELVIDPLVRLWATFYGGAQTLNYENCVDSLGNLFFTGYTYATNLIASTGAFQTVHGGNTDIFLAKFHRNGTKLWSTYYGSTGKDDALGVAADPVGNIFIGGTTTSTANVATPGAFKDTLSGSMDALIAKFDSSGTRLWATYFGDTAIDHSYNCTTDHFGNIIVVGGTGILPGTTLLGTPGCQQPLQGGNIDGFVVKFDSQGNRLWSTYLGGINYDMARSVACDHLNNIFVCGDTGSPNNIASTSAFQTTCTVSNGFLIKYDFNVLRQWGTYFGGSVSLSASGIACDRTGNVYISGMVDGSSQNNHIATPGSHQPIPGGGLSDIFLAKFNTTGGVLWATYYGSTELEGSWSCVTDSRNNVYFSAFTLDTMNALASPGAFQTTNSALGSMLLVKFDSNGVRKRATYYSQVNEESFCLAIDKFDEVTMGGNSSATSGAYLTTPGAYQSTGNIPAPLIVKFFDCEDDVTHQVFVNNGCFNTVAPSATINPGGPGVYSYTWLPSGGNSNIASNLSTGTYTCFMDHLCGSESRTIVVNQPTSAISISLQTSDTLVCEGYSVSINASYSGGQPPYNIMWSTGASGQTIVESPTVNTVYSFSLTDANHCKETANYLQLVESCVGIKEINTETPLTIHPNPASEFVLIKMERIYTLLVVNSLGQVVYYSKECPANLNMSSFQSGTYLFQFTNESESRHFKVVKL